MPSKTVVVFGEMGSGKSSTINLLMGRPVARASDSAVDCTFSFEKYATADYTLFETVGLLEGCKGTMSQSTATGQLVSLLKSLTDGISLLIFVMEKGRIRKSLEESYKLFSKVICDGNVPVILLITHCEMEVEPGTWWRENEQYFINYSMTFKSVISGCCMPFDTAPLAMQSGIKKLNESTLLQLRQAIQDNMRSSGYLLRQWIRPPGYTHVASLLGMFIFPGMGLEVGRWEPNRGLEGRLRDFFIEQGYTSDVARTMARDITNSM